MPLSVSVDRSVMDRPDLAEELLRLAAEDLALRHRLAQSGQLFGHYHEAMRAVHRGNGTRLSAILDELGCWPGYRLVGREGSDAAFVIGQHDIGNPSLLRRCRDLYAAAVEEGEADPENLARIEDRICYLEGRPQRFGTHLGWGRTGKFGPWPPVEDPSDVDSRRKAVGLPPLAEAVAAARANRPVQRSVREVLDEHRRADAFAHETGWRDGIPDYKGRPAPA